MFICGPWLAERSGNGGDGAVAVMQMMEVILRELYIDLEDPAYITFQRVLEEGGWGGVYTAASPYTTITPPLHCHQPPIPPPPSAPACSIAFVGQQALFASVAE
ncbi:unnamed protein product [Lota lota]